MRRKLERSASIGNNNNTINMVLLITCAVIVSTVVLFSLSILMDKGVNSFVQYQDQYDIQNECIADLVGNGIPRKDITRQENGCSYNIGE